MENKFNGRSIIFFVVAIILTILVYSIFHYGKIQAKWYIQPIIVTILALLYTFYPVTCTRALSLVLVIPLGIVAIIVGGAFWIIIFLIMVCTFFIQIILSISIFAIPGFILIYGGHKFFNELGAMLGSAIIGTAIVAFAKDIFKKSKKKIYDTWVNGWKRYKGIAEDLHDTIISWTVFPDKLVDYIWEGAKKIGDKLGGDINAFFTKLGEFIIDLIFG